MITPEILERCVKARWTAPDGPWAFTRAALVEFLSIIRETPALAIPPELHGQLIFMTDDGKALTGQDAYIAWHRQLTLEASKAKRAPRSN